MTTTEAAACLIDTNVLLRLSQGPVSSPAYHRAIEHLRSSGAGLCMAFQNVAEFVNVATRPENRNGLGLSPEQASREVLLLQRQFQIVTENRQTYDRWIGLLRTYGVSGRQVHDCRLVAVMLVHGIPALLTSNTQDFVRYHGIRLIDPEHVKFQPDVAPSSA